MSIFESGRKLMNLAGVAGSVNFDAVHWVNCQFSSAAAIKTLSSHSQGPRVGCLSITVSTGPVCAIATPVGAAQTDADRTRREANANWKDMSNC